jgi:DNA-3-methyladenine glycosylase
MFDLPRAGERRRLLALLSQPAPDAARLLLGHLLVRRLRRGVLTIRIVETEAYLPEGDAAAHVFRGRTARNAPLYGPPGNVYVYFVYGMHHCLNLAVDREGVPGCVLIRAGEVLPPLATERDGACRGPGRLCRMLELTTRDSGLHLFAADARLTLREGLSPRRTGVSVRVGIRKASKRPLRFYDADSRAVSP